MGVAPRPELLAAHRAVRTRDVDEAQSQLSRIFSPHTLEPSAAGEFCARANALDLGHVKLVYLDLGTAVTIRPEPLGYYAVNVALGGRSEVRHGAAGAVCVGGAVAGSVINPGSAFEMRWSAEHRQLPVLEDRRGLESRVRSAARAPGGSTALAGALDVRNPAARSWLELVRWVVADADHGGLTANPLAAASVEDMLIAGLLAAQGSADEDAPGGPGLADRAARAADYVHQHLDEPITVTDVARAAGVGVRTLQSLFRERYGVSPSVYLRDARLDRVHRELCGHAGTVPATVTTAATRWGFAHVPRFAAQYRRRFDESPSVTLRRTRAS